MARKNFNAGAEVAATEGVNFVNASVGAHSSVLSGVIHLGNYQDVFTKGGVSETKKPCNWALAIFTLMGKKDLNEDGTRIRTFKPFPLKNGDKAWMTRILDAVDPNEVAGGFDDVIGNICSVTMTGSDETGEDGLPKYVNFGGVSAENEEMAEIIAARAEAEGLENVGHIQFDAITEDIMKIIPAHYIRQYLLSEGKGSSLNFKGSKAEEVFNAIRAEDANFAKKKESDKKDKPAEQASASKQTQVPSEVPAENVDAPEMDEEAEY